jgi:hypothetical protein
MPLHHDRHGFWHLEQQHADSCSLCDKTLGSTAYMVRANERPLYRRQRPRSAPICEGCVTPEQRGLATEVWPCEGCGRTMIACVRHFQKRFCSTSCQTRSWQRRNVRPRLSIICGACHKSFQPKREDAKFCSNACRQKAYRRRPPGDPEPASPSEENLSQRDETPPRGPTAPR